MKPKPSYKVGDQVIRSGLSLHFTGVVTKVFQPSQINEAIATIVPDPENHKHGKFIQAFLDGFRKRDKDFHKYPMYAVQPHSYPGVASYEEAQSICPYLTRTQYDLIVGNMPRSYLVLDSDLLPASMQST